MLSLKQTPRRGIEEAMYRTLCSLVLLGFMSLCCVWIIAQDTGVIGAGRPLVSFSNQPSTANPGNKASAIGWVNGLVAAGWTCMEDGGVTTLQIANQSSKPLKKMLVLGDGVPTCNGSDTSAQTLASITSANWQGIPIDTLYISADGAGISFMQALAAQNNGTFTLVE